MDKTDGLLEGVVYAIVDGYPGPDRAISAEEAAATEDPDLCLHQDLLIGGGGSIERIKHWYLISLESRILRAKLSSVAALAQVSLPRAIDPDRIYIHRGEGPINEELLDLDERTYLEIDSTGVAACVEERYAHRPAMSRSDYRITLDSIVRNYGCRIVEIEYSDVSGNSIEEDFPSIVTVDEEGIEDDDDIDWTADLAHVVVSKIACDNPNALAEQLITCGRAVHDYLAAVRGAGELDAPRIVSVLRGGHIQILVGRQESDYLEVKSSQYNIKAPGQTAERQRIELAQDVARFANGDRDAVLVLGYTEKKLAGVTTVGQPALMDLTHFDVEQYQAVLDSKIVPSISGLVIEKVLVDADSNTGIVFVYVPRQAEEMQPYLVQGAIVADKIEGAFFSIVQRRGEASITVSASQIHGYIVAGKAFLRRSE
jgi:hypothetical protein